MATITSAQSGNFSATTTWVGGVVPVAVDIAVAATGHIIAIDVDVTVTKVTQSGTGKFTLGNGRALAAEVEANAGTFTSGGTVEVTATTSATITGNVTGLSTTSNNTAAIVVTGTGTLTVNGSVTGSPGNGSSEANGSAAIYTNTTCTIIVNGAVTGGSGNNKRGILTDTSSNAIVRVNNGTSNAVLAGSTGQLALSYGVLMNGTSPRLEVTGNLVANSGSSAARQIGASATAIIAGNITGGTAISGVTPSGFLQDGSNASLTVTGNVFGNNAGVGGGAHGILQTGLSSVVSVTGNVTGNTSGNVGSSGILSSGNSASVTVVGNVAGGTTGTGVGGVGISAGGTAVAISVTGNVTGGNTSGSHGISAAGNSTTRIISVVGTVTATTAISGIGSHGIYETNASGGWVVVGGSLIDSAQGDCAVSARRFRCIPTLNTIRQHTNNTGYPNGSPITYGSLDYIPNNVPAPANVRSGTVYGNNQYTGTLAVPPASAVSSGVPVDNTVGTGVVSPADIAGLVGAQIAALLSS